MKSLQEYLMEINDGDSRLKEDDMDNNELLKVYIEKVDRDQSDLRADIKESERRTTEQVSRIESRMDDRLNRIENLISETNERVERKIDDMQKDNKETKHWIIGVCIATIAAIAAMVITVVLAA